VLFGMYASLLIALHTEKHFVIRCDSQVVVEFWSKRLATFMSESLGFGSKPKAAPKKAQTMDTAKVRIIREVIKLRKEFETKKGRIEKISGDSHPADLGYHK
jgi:hypothetical protein